MGRSDSPPSISTRFQFFTSRYHRVARGLLPSVVGRDPQNAAERGRPTGGQGVVGSGLPIRIDDGNVGVSQVPWKPWWSLSVLFDPGRIRQAEWTKSKLPDTAPACVHDEGSRRLVLSGAITRPLTSLSTLRRMGRPTTTQDSLLAAGPALPGGIRTRRVSAKGFRVQVSSSFPKLT